MEALVGIFGFIESVGVVGGLLVIAVLSVLGFAGYAAKRYMDHSIEHDSRLMEIEERKENDQKEQFRYLREASTRQETLYNTTLNSVDKLAEVIDRVSINLTEQNQRSVEMMNQIHDIRNSMPSRDTVQFIHNKVEDMQRTTPDKDDVRQILAAISEVGDKVQNVNAALSTIRLTQLNN